jgi:hypothetical protein
MPAHRKPDPPLEWIWASKTFEIALTVGACILGLFVGLVVLALWPITMWIWTEAITGRVHDPMAVTRVAKTNVRVTRG